MSKEMSGSRFKKAILPPLVGLLFMAVVLGILNSQYISARIAYSLSSKNISDSPAIARAAAKTPTRAQNANPTLIIPRINVTAPTVIDESVSSENGVQEALKNGIFHFPGTAFPGQKGNIVIIGHSSGRFWETGNYKYVFSLLEKLKNNDVIYYDYEGIRYTYKVTDMQIVDPTQVSVLNQTEDSRITLITCHPVGSNKQRLIVTAELIDPQPEEKTAIEGFQDPQTRINNQVKDPARSTSLWNSLHKVL